MTVEGLLSLRGNNIILIKASESYNIIDLVRAKKEACGASETKTYDVNSDGVVDGADLAFIRKELLGSGGEVVE